MAAGQSVAKVTTQPLLWIRIQKANALRIWPDPDLDPTWTFFVVIEEKYFCQTGA
jgi:hypothetical protein